MSQTVVVFVILGLFVFSGKSAAEPALLLDKKSVDLGDVAQGETIEYTLVLRNIGTDPLIIEKVTSS